jgi:hypothetical protein
MSLDCCGSQADTSAEELAARPVRGSRDQDVGSRSARGTPRRASRTTRAMPAGEAQRVISDTFSIQSATPSEAANLCSMQYRGVTISTASDHAVSASGPPLGQPDSPASLASSRSQGNTRGYSAAPISPTVNQSPEKAAQGRPDLSPTSPTSPGSSRTSRGQKKRRGQQRDRIAETASSARRQQASGDSSQNQDPKKAAANYPNMDPNPSEKRS